MRKILPIAALATAACGAPAAPAPRWDLVVEAGDQQQAAAATFLSQPLVVRILGSGQPVSNAIVTVRVTGGNGTVWIPGRRPAIGVGAAITERTGRDGRSEFFLAVGTEVGVYSFAVTANGPVNGDSATTVRATAVAGPASVVARSGDGQVGSPSQPLADPVGLRLLDDWGNPTGEIVVTWSVVEGGGAVRDSVTVSTPRGRSPPAGPGAAVRDLNGSMP